jgi:hypothetical protein
MVRKAQPVRAVILPAAIGGLGNHDEHHVDPRLGGLTVAWIPGDHGVTMMLGGFTQNGAQQEPALTLFISAQSVGRLAKRGFPTISTVGAAWLQRVAADKAFEDEHGFSRGYPYEWVEYYRPEISGEELYGRGYYGGAAHCVVLAKSDPLQPPETLSIYHTGTIRRTGKPSKLEDQKPHSRLDGRVMTWELDEEHTDCVLVPDEDRMFLLELEVPEPVKVFLTADEVDDLMIVLRYRPDWWYEPTELKG